MGTVKSRVRATFVSCVALIAVSAAAAEAAWTPPSPIVDEGAAAAFVFPAADNQATAVWQQEGVVTMTRLAPDGTPGTLIPLSGAGATALDAAATPDGTVNAVWIGADETGKTVRIAADGTPGEVKDFESPEGEDASTEAPQVAVAPDGTATIVWRDDTGFGTARMTRVAPDGTLADPDGQSLAVGGVNLPQIAVGPDGTATASWSDLLNQQRAVAMQINPAGEPGTELTLHSDDQIFNATGVTVGPNGVATVAYSCSCGGTAIKARRITGGSVGTELSVATSSGTPVLAADENNVVTVAWRSGALPVVSGRLITAAGNLSTSDPLSSSGAASGPPSLSPLPGGGVMAAWSRNGHAEVARPATPGGLPTSVTAISPGPNASRPQVANAPDGTSDVVWVEGGALNVSVYDTTDPVIAGYSAPATANVGSQYTVSADISDPRAGVDSIVWDFGDGSTNTGNATANHAYFASGTYDVSLTVTDKAGNESTQSSQVTVSIPSPPPPPGPLPGAGLPGGGAAKKCKKKKKKKGKKASAAAKKKKQKKKCKKKKRR
jgi:hypothetical protein